MTWLPFPYFRFYIYDDELPWTEGDWKYREYILHIGGYQWILRKGRK
jgi:hypothetical protein